jgi:hypothetical protein
MISGRSSKLVLELRQGNMEAQDPRQKAVGQDRSRPKAEGRSEKQDLRARPQAERDGSVFPVVPAEAGTQKFL